MSQVGKTMTELEQLWRRKPDYELLAAPRRLHEYSEASQRAITAEVERRKSPKYLRSLEASQPPTVQKMQHISEQPPAYTNSPAWLAQRALLAIGLMIGFYVLAMAIALAPFVDPVRRMDVHQSPGPPDRNRVYRFRPDDFVVAAPSRRQLHASRPAARGIEMPATVLDHSSHRGGDEMLKS